MENSQWLCKNNVVILVIGLIQGVKVSTILTAVLVILAVMFLFNALSSRLFPSLSAKDTKDVNIADENPTNPTDAQSIYDFSVLDIDGNLCHLSKYKGFVTYIVNVATQ